MQEGGEGGVLSTVCALCLGLREVQLCACTCAGTLCMHTSDVLQEVLEHLD